MKKLKTGNLYLEFHWVKYIIPLKLAKNVHSNLRNAWQNRIFDYFCQLQMSITWEWINVKSYFFSVLPRINWLQIKPQFKLTLSWRRPLSYRNQSWFLYDNGLRHERVKLKLLILEQFSCWFLNNFHVRIHCNSLSNIHLHATILLDNKCMGVFLIISYWIAILRNNSQRVLIIFPDPRRIHKDVYKGCAASAKTVFVKHLQSCVNHLQSCNFLKYFVSSIVTLVI